MENGELNERACAKINLFLDVVGKRADGYHELETVMQSISLHDTLTFEKSTNTSLSFSFNSPFSIPNSPFSILNSPFSILNSPFPKGEGNIIIRAVHLLQARHGIPGAKIHLTKRIPMGAGLAGGSTDAAATLRGLNRLYDLQLPSKELWQLALALGADVPFCLEGGTQHARGIGEILTPLPPIPPCHIVLIAPPVHVSTPTAFAALPPQKHGKGDNSLTISAITNKNLHSIGQSLYNVFQENAIKTHPEIQEAIIALKATNALATSMTGTGSALYAIFEDEQTAKSTAKKLKNAIYAKPI
jgi:4-diphosphocytidyl-2-C-methyl-D-erythritol kinase